MDFNDTPEEAAFRAEAVAFLQAHATLKTAVKNRFDRFDASSEEEKLKAARAWQKTKAENRFAQITWPEKWGGRGGTAMQQVIYSQEEAKYSVPSGMFFGIGLGMIVPTVMQYADEETCQRFVGPALRGEEIWCQLFSEPAAGSDLAGVRTRAERDGDDWIINGQKVWTSGAHYSDYGMVVVRTDPSVPKHKGLTAFWLDMKSPGIDVRPLRQAPGLSEFNEVYFSDVRVPDSQRLGEVGGGWKAALTTLMHERLAVGELGGTDWPDLVSLAQTIQFEDGPAIDDPAVRDRLADWYVQSQGLKYTRYRIMTALSRGQTPGPENSISKIVVAKKMQDLASFAMDIQEMGGLITEREHTMMKGVFPHYYLWAAGMRLAGGTDEILRNIVAERVLGLPPEIRVDKEVSFAELVGRTS